MGLEHKTDLETVAQSRILSQYKESPLIVALIGAIAALIQEVEDAYWDLFNAVFLDTATGVWLEYLGAIVGEPREGASDADYRVYIRARVLANRSSGTIDEVLTIVAMLVPSVIGDAFESAVEFYPASMLIIINPNYPVSSVVRNRMDRIVSGARPTGVRLMINSIEGDPVDAFTLCSSSDAQPVIDAGEGLGDSGDPNTGGQLSSGDLA